MGPPLARNAPPSDGITVSAAGTVTAPADVGTVVLRLYAQKTSLTPELLNRIVDGIVAAGIPRENVTLPPAVAPRGVPLTGAELTVTIEHPTADSIKRSLPALLELAAALPSDVNANAEVRLSVAHCEGLVDAARAEAIRVAHARAAAAAKNLGVQIGPVKAFTSTDPQVDARGDCGASYVFPNYGGSPSLDDYVSVRLTSNVTVRYAIR